MNEVSQPLSDPASATAEDGQVILEGPRGLAVTMTPDAAARTGHSLLEAAREAQRQQTESHRSGQE
jgi:hypothetical protein